MRMRKKGWAEPYLNSHPECVIFDGNSKRGQWGSGYASVHLEIGCGKGDYITKMALANPTTLWIGIEKELNVAAITAKKIVEQEVTNALLLPIDASSCLSWFDDSEIDAIHLNFSDPWVQRGYRKRRLSHGLFLQEYSRILKIGGNVIMKTDNRSLFEFSLVEFAQYNYQLMEVSLDFRSTHNDDAISEYEAKFIADGLKIHRGIFKSPKR